MHVKTRQQFDQFIADMKRTRVRVFDTETRGLKMYKGDTLISLSVYLPEIKKCYNLAFFNGEGTVQIDYTKENTSEKSFHEMNWQGKTKKQVYLAHWYREFQIANEWTNYWENLPADWLDEIKAVWGKGIYIGHNTRFDAHVLYVEGFPDMETVYDTMVALHIVNEDWRGQKFEAPYKYTQKDAKEGVIPEDKIGQWAIAGDGKLLLKDQYGNRGLKWQAALRGFENAALGEQGLNEARLAFEDTLTDFIMTHLIDSDMNKGLATKAQYKTLTTVPGTPEWKDAYDKVWDKVRSKVELDDKANMWMLPSGQVAYYAELDVILTYQLYEWCMPIIREWHNEELFEKQSAIHHRVAWEMERNGLRLDKKQAQAEIDKLTPRIQEIEKIVAQVAYDWLPSEVLDELMAEGEAILEPDEFKIASPKQLLPLLNSGVLGKDFGTSLFPDWWDVNQALELKTYPNIQVREDELEEGYDKLEGTAKAELQRVQDHPLVRLVRHHRMLKKTVTTYLEKWLGAVDPNGIVHGSIDDTGTVAGRAASSGDAGNLQNIPDRGAYTVKKAFIPYSPEWAILAIDYGQLELRLGAWIAETLLGLDKAMTMTNLFLSGNDMHSWVRDTMGIREILFPGLDDRQIVIRLGYPLDGDKSNTPEKWATLVAEYCRFVAKTMNFGLLYSGGHPMLSKLLRLETEVAKVLVYKWRDMFPAFPKAQAYLTKLALTRRQNPSGTNWGMYVTQPISGRHRKIHRYATEQWYKENDEWLKFNPMEAAARKVWNNTDQGLGGFICMYSALRIGDELGRDNIKMFANIHDSLDMYIRIDALHLAPKIEAIMVDWNMIVPNLTVDASASLQNWHDMKKIKNMQEWIDTKGIGGYK